MKRIMFVVLCIMFVACSNMTQELSTEWRVKSVITGVISIRELNNGYLEGDTILIVDYSNRGVNKTTTLNKYVILSKIK